MFIEVNTDHNIRGTESLSLQVRGIVEDSLDNFSTRLTRVIVHLSDENGDKSGPDDKKCLLECRLENFAPIVVSHRGENVIQCLDVACDKMHKALTNAIGKLRDRRVDTDLVNDLAAQDTSTEDATAETQS